MPDEGEGLLDRLGELADDAIHVETLMGWDGDPCRCAVCDCPLFLDGADETRCRDCKGGRHPGPARQS